MEAEIRKSVVPQNTLRTQNISSLEITYDFGGDKSIKDRTQAYMLQQLTSVNLIPSHNWYSANISVTLHSIEKGD